MSHFCMYCGKKLEDNENCDCAVSLEKAAALQKPPQQEGVQQPVPPYVAEHGQPTPPQMAGNQQPVPPPMQGGQPMPPYGAGYGQSSPPPHKPSRVGAAFKNVFPFIKSLVQKPGNAVAAIAKNSDIPLALIYLCTFILFFGLFSYITVCKVLNIFGGNVNFFLAMLYGILLAVLLEAITVLIIFVIGKIYKSDATIKQALVVSAVTYIYPLMCIILACITWFISITVTLAVVVLAFIAWLITLLYAIKVLHHTNENSHFLLVMILVLTFSACLSGVIIKEYTGWAQKQVIKSSYSDDYFNGLFDGYLD